MMTTSAGTLIFRISLLLVVLIAIDLYAFKGIKTSFSNIESVFARQVIFWVYWGISIVFFIGIIYSLSTLNKFAGPSRGQIALLMGSFILFYIPKLIIVSFLLIEDV